MEICAASETLTKRTTILDNKTTGDDEKIMPIWSLTLKYGETSLKALFIIKSGQERFLFITFFFLQKLLFAEKINGTASEF